MNRILIVDDEPNILMSLEFLLRRSGFEVYVARNGQEAMDCIQNNNISLVLLDIMMPDVDGYQICEYIKSNDKTKDISVFFLSAKSKAEDIQKGLELGADQYIVKPFSTRDLVQKIKFQLKYTP